VKSKWLILDRFHISSLIYNKLYKRNYDVSYINEAEISPFLVVYVSVTKEILLQRATHREECNLILDKLTELHKAYEDFFATYKGPFIKVDGNEDVNINAELIYNRLRQA
jgi:thymidylate kinase